MGLGGNLNTSKKPIVWIVLGPTASGKSGLSVKLAQESFGSRQGCLICADSIQMYTGLPILTAQPTSEELRAAPHRLYGVLPPQTKGFSAASWRTRLVQEAQQVIAQGLQAVVVGGTGFYIKSLLEGLSPMPFVPVCITHELEKKETATLYSTLQTEDPAMASALQPQDRQRIIRALAIWRTTGTSWYTWRKHPPQHCAHTSMFTFRVVCIMPSAESLNKRIEERLQAMVQEGVFEEVKQFAIQHLNLTFPLTHTYPKPQHAEHLTKKDIACLLHQCDFTHEAWPCITKALGFYELLLAVCGVLAYPQALHLVNLRTRQYAKRQRTWLRHQLKSTPLVSDIFIYETIDRAWLKREQYLYR